MAHRDKSAAGVFSICPSPPSTPPRRLSPDLFLRQVMAQGDWAVTAAQARSTRGCESDL